MEFVTWLSDRQLYIFKSVFSLFGKFDVGNASSSSPMPQIHHQTDQNCVHKDWKMGACVFQVSVFTGKTDDYEILDDDKVAWDLLNTTMKDFLAFTNESQSGNLKMTEKTQTPDSIHFQ